MLVNSRLVRWLSASGPASMFHMPNLSTSIRGRSLVAVVANLFGEVQGRRRRPSNLLRTHLPLGARRCFDYERSGAAASVARTRAEVKDAACCGPPDCEFCRRDTRPSRAFQPGTIVHAGQVWLTRLPSGDGTSRQIAEPSLGGWRLYGERLAHRTGPAGSLIVGS
jgi:hypothetical protein